MFAKKQLLRDTTATIFVANYTPVPERMGKENDWRQMSASGLNYRFENPNVLSIADLNVSKNEKDENGFEVGGM